MSKSIKLSPEHGLNPTIPVCFYCGENKNEIILCGHIGDKRKGEDIAAPQHVAWDYEPCDKCKENMALGITLIGYNTKPNQPAQPPISKQDGMCFYPTGSWSVIKEEAIKRIMPPDIANAAIKQRKLLVEQPILMELLSQSQDNTETDTNAETETDVE